MEDQFENNFKLKLLQIKLKELMETAMTNFCY